MGFPGQPTTRLASFMMVENRNICLTREKKKTSRMTPQLAVRHIAMQHDRFTFQMFQTQVQTGGSSAPPCVSLPFAGCTSALRGVPALVTAPSLLLGRVLIHTRSSRYRHSPLVCSSPACFLEITAVYYGHMKPF